MHSAALASHYAPEGSTITANVFALIELSVPVHTFASAKSVGIGLMTAFGAAIGRPLLTEAV